MTNKVIENVVSAGSGSIMSMGYFFASIDAEFFVDLFIQCFVAIVVGFLGGIAGWTAKELVHKFFRWQKNKKNERI